eukprot:scaffold68882_cov33-Phaeocystis_antarctica.AAC.2
MELAHRYRVCGAGSGREGGAAGGNRASTATDADAGRGDASRGTSAAATRGGEAGAPPHRRASALNADAGRADASRGTSGGEAGVRPHTPHRRASALSGGLQLQLRRECGDVLRWFADGSPPGNASGPGP